MKSNINKLDPWASDGGTQIDPPLASKVARGWNPGDQPPSQWENWRVNRDNLKTNEIIDGLNARAENDLFDTLYDRCSGLPGSNAALNPASPVNRLDVTDPAIVSICRGYDWTNKRECVFGLQGTPSDPRIVKIGNNPDGEIEEIEIPVNFSTAYVPIDLCCDGYYIFVIYTQADDGSGNPVSHIYRVPIGPSYTHGVAPEYDAHLVTTDSATTAPVLTGENGSGGRRICVADADHIAFIDSRNAGVAIVAKDLESFETGSGNASSLPVEFSSLAVSNTGICSDGTRVWCTYNAMYGGDGVYVLCAVLISSPSRPGAGLTRDWETDPIYWPNSVEGEFLAGVTSLVFDGAAINVTGNVRKDLDNTHYAFVHVFDVSAEQYYYNRVRVTSGHGYSGLCNGSSCFTGRRIATVNPVNPFDDMSDPDIDEICNIYQYGLALIPVNRGGVNNSALVLFDSEQSYSITDQFVTALENCAVATEASRIAFVAFADDCIWAIKYVFPLADPGVTGIELIRVPCISGRY
jgi:hypothetical protein